MPPSQTYMLTIYDLFIITDAGVVGAENEVAILYGGVEIDRVRSSGKCQSKDGYGRAYTGKPGLTAIVASGPGRVLFEKAEVRQAASVR